MIIKIEKKVIHQEWNEAHLTPKQFIEFSGLYFSKDYGDDGLPDKYSIAPTFVFDNGSVWTDESWDICEEGYVSTSSFCSGVMGFDDQENEYIEHVHGREKRLGQLVSVKFSADDEMLKQLKELTN